MGIPHLKLDLGRVSEPSSTVTGQSLNPALKRGVNWLQQPVRPRILGRSRDSGGLMVGLQYVMGYFFGSKQLNLSFSL